MESVLVVAHAQPAADAARAFQARQRGVVQELHIVAAQRPAHGDLVPSDSTVALAAAVVIVGAVVSVTTTLKVVEAVLPLASVAVAVTTVVPRPNAVPEFWL